MSSSSATSSGSKIPNIPQQLPLSSQAQTVSLVTLGDGNSSRRSGSGIHTKAMSTPRNTQSLRKQHKGPRRPKLGGEDQSAESAAIRSPGSRKGQTSITHLMNFTLPPRPTASHSISGRHTGFRRPPTWGLGSGHHANDKARYIHANYRFIVDPKGDYHAQAADADVHLDWNNVLQILASAQSQSTSCPICLSVPVAPRMAKCGHIFCLPCLIRYMHSTDDTHPIPEKKSRWKKCPICWDSVYLWETRPVRWFIGQEGEPPQEGSDIVLRLMVRRPGSILALPRDSAEIPKLRDDIPWYSEAEVTDYARAMKGSEDYMEHHFDREINELLAQEQEDEVMFGEETQWTKKAIAAILDAKSKIVGIGNPPVIEHRSPKIVIDGIDSELNHNLLSNPNSQNRPPIAFSKNELEFYRIQQAVKSGQSVHLHIDPDSKEEDVDDASNSSKGKQSSNVNIAVPSEAPASSNKGPSRAFGSSVSSRPQVPSRLQTFAETPFFFYQALLHYYLSPLDIRILKAAFGDFSSFPTTILPRVERVSTGHIIDDELRKRAKYLAHLPYGCEVGFLECDWTDVVSPEVLLGFSGEIERRRKKNTEKASREEKERIRAEKEEDDKRWAAARRTRPSISTLGTEAATSAAIMESLAQMDLTDASASPPWPNNQNGFSSLASPSSSPQAPRTVWGTTAVSGSSPPIYEPRIESSENDGWLQDWERELIRDDGDHKAGAFGESAFASISDAGAIPISQSKKKKNKKITLMSTNARRAA